MSEDRIIRVTVNGEPRQTAGGQTVLEFLRSLDLDPSRIAIELDRNILKRPEWESTPLRDGARLEVVQFVGGG